MAMVSNNYGMQPQNVKYNLFLYFCSSMIYFLIISLSMSKYLQKILPMFKGKSTPSEQVGPHL